MLYRADERYDEEALRLEDVSDAILRDTHSAKTQSDSSSNHASENKIVFQIQGSTDKIQQKQWATKATLQPEVLAVGFYKALVHCGSVEHTVDFTVLYLSCGHKWHFVSPLGPRM